MRGLQIQWDIWIQGKNPGLGTRNWPHWASSSQGMIPYKSKGSEVETNWAQSHLGSCQPGEWPPPGPTALGHRWALAKSNPLAETKSQPIPPHGSVEWRGTLVKPFDLYGGTLHTVSQRDQGTIRRGLLFQTAKKSIKINQSVNPLFAK